MLAKTSIAWGLEDRKLRFSGHHTMGIRNRNSVFFGVTIPWRKGQERTAGKQRERDRVREKEIPEFPKTRRARAAFWQHEPYLEVFWSWEQGGEADQIEFRIVSGRKVIMWGGVACLWLKWNLDS